MMGVPEWVLPALAQGAAVVPFLDFPETFNANPAPDRRLFDSRTLTSFTTPKDQFFTTQHYGHPVLDDATFTLKVSGLVNTPKAFSIANLKAMPKGEVMFGFECSGNRAPVQGLCSNGKWTGVPLAALLKDVGVKADAREFVFLGADHGVEEVEWRTQKYSLDQQFGRSMPREKALSPEPLVAYAYNDEPLTRHQGFPLRLIVPGWYGVANVKWLSDIVVQQRFRIAPRLGELGHFKAHDRNPRNTPLFGERLIDEVEEQLLGRAATSIEHDPDRAAYIRLARREHVVEQPVESLPAEFRQCIPNRFAGDRTGAEHRHISRGWRTRPRDPFREGSRRPRARARR